MLTRPDFLLRIEALLVLLTSAIYYSFILHGRWPLFILLFLMPDLSLFGYLAKDSKHVGAAIYNSAQNYAVPAILGLTSWKWHAPLAGQITLIWIAHIAADRLLGFGLKYPQAFRPTHIQNVGIFHPQ